MKSDEDIRAELKLINHRIRSVDQPVTHSRTKAYIGYFLVIAVAVFGISILAHFGPSITGFVTFSETVERAEDAGFSVSESGSVRVSTDLERVNAMMLSGRVYGDGKAAVFVQGPERNHLAYYFEGDAGDGVEFSDMCYDTCHVEGLGGENTLVFELDNTRIDIDSIRYSYNRIIDFDLQPRKIGIDYSEGRASVIELTLTNRELTDYSVLLYIDGPLSSSFSWQGSLIHMTPEQPRKVIPITVKLPSNLREGEYTHRITARYVPPDTYDFAGEAPVAETFVTVYA